MRWFSSWYTRVFAFVMASVVGPGAAPAQDDPDTTAWLEATRIDTFEAYQRYLEEFPVGRYAGEAFRAMIEESLDQEFGDQGGAAADLY